jgi:pyrroline-5-carboxylate reductase
LKNSTIAIIGGGNLGAAIAEGLIYSRFAKATDIIVTRRNVAALRELEKKGVTVTADNKKAVQQAGVVILAVKPYNYAEILGEIKAAFNEKNHLLISVITGVSMDDLEKALGKKIPLVRAMPNTAIAIRESMTCVCSRHVKPADNEYVMTLFAKLGSVVTIEEKLMEAATVLAACGTAYAMRYIRANIQGGIEIGFDAATASLIAAQTVKGAAELLLQKGTHPEYEIDKVTTPKGCTIAGLNEMEHQGFSSSLIKGIATSYKKIAKD